MSKTLTLLGVAALVAVVAYLMSSVGERQLDLPASDTALDEAAKNQLAAKASIAQIAAESEAIDAPATGEETTPVRAEAPPGFVPAPVVHQATPPEGYSFASHHEVARGPMTEYDIDRAQAPADLPAWMAHGEANLGVQAAAAGRAWSFGWVRLSEGADLEELRDLLAAHGGEALGQAGDLVRARLPGDPARLEAIARAGSVAGVGALPPEVKVADGLAELQTNGSDLPVWITLMSDDPDGRWRRALQGLGAEVGRFDPALRSYAATIPAVALGPVSQADYVLAVESIGRVEPTLEIATTAMGADSVRSYDAGMETFVGTGGASVTVGVMDTGLNVDHPDISSNRRSICGANFAVSADGRADDQVLWFDRFLHGTHVTGILAGNGAVQRNRAGMAPLVQDIRVAKATNVAGRASALGWNRAMDWFATPTACGGDGVPRKALVINSSIGVTGDYWVGRSIGERKIDASVWAARQLFVTSTGNSATSASSSMAGAKNALTVGAASNTGDIAVFSSRGPTADGRLMPKIVGTGVAVLSPRGGGSTGRYFLASGTSMASPSVAGVAALVMDAIPELKEEPAAVRARLMASAIKPDAFLGDDAAFPLDNTNGPGTFNNAYGLGKVSARTAVLSRDDEDGWIGGSASFDIDEDSHAYHDIVVPEGASRLDIVMTWDEPPAEVITTPVLHDLDLWVDRGASCGNVAACGKYTSRSRVDNVEWVIVPNPPAGVYRLKVLPNRIYGPAPRAGLGWTVIRGDSSPSLGVAVDREVIEVAPDVPFEVDVTVSSDAYVAAGANLRVECRTAVGSTACDAFNLEGAQLPFSRDDSSLVREDALERSLARDVLIALGELGPDEQQNVSLKFAGQPEGSFRLHIAAASWNGAGGDASVAVIVGDSDLPAPVQRPPNDDFAMAIELDAEGGETTFDLMAATPDPGEPTLEIGGLPTRPRSLWYVWTAPETGLAQFAVARSTLDDYADLVVVDAFRDAPLAGLAAIGGTQLGGGKTFFAERGETYRIRLSVDTRLLFSTPPPQQRPQERRSLSFPELVLRWGPGSRPDNDDYAFAADLQGENGIVAGTGQGATTEPAEFMGHSNADYPEDTGGWLSSVWYRWTAPSTGDFVFYVNRASQAVAVFAGDSLSGARMVSGAPFFEVVFPATEGVEYRIGVANRDADWAGTDFELGWAPDERINPGNDDFAAAAQTFGDSAFTPVDFNTMTVEHGEPDASGVRTAWWVWQPSADGRYTWLAERLGGFQKDDAPLNRAAFAGDELHTLEAVAVRDGSEGFAEQLVFDARADTAYRFALGLPRDAAQTSLEPGYVSMRWGPTPDNDDFANAVALTGMSGSVGGSNEFATNEKGERTGTLGDSSLWWTFQSDESGWVRFVVDGPPGRSSRSTG